MKKLFFIAMFCCFALAANAQSKVYCEIIERPSLTNKSKIMIDFGEDRGGVFDVKALADENGKSLKIKSVVDALNYMVQKGWEFVQAYSVVMVSNGQGVSDNHYILCKTSDSNDTEEIIRR